MSTVKEDFALQMEAARQGLASLQAAKVPFNFAEVASLDLVANKDKAVLPVGGVAAGDCHGLFVTDIAPIQIPRRMTTRYWGPGGQSDGMMSSIATTGLLVKPAGADLVDVLTMTRFVPMGSTLAETPGKPFFISLTRPRQPGRPIELCMERLRVQAGRKGRVTGFPYYDNLVGLHPLMLFKGDQPSPDTNGVGLPLRLIKGGLGRPET